MNFWMAGGRSLDFLARWSGLRAIVGTEVVNYHENVNCRRDLCSAYGRGIRVIGIEVDLVRVIGTVSGAGIRYSWC